MKIVDASYEILTTVSPYATCELEFIEQAARTCYKSEDKILDQAESARKLIASLINKGHEAMLEHSTLTVKFICDRGVSHELVRHRLASFAQESTRYCNYSKDKFGNEITVVRPWYFKPVDHPTDPAYDIWLTSCENAENAYFHLLNLGYSPQQARCVLPNSLKTEVVITANYREWRHILMLRCAHDAHPQMRELMMPLLRDLHDMIPVVFDDIFDRFYETKEEK